MTVEDIQKSWSIEIKRLNANLLEYIDGTRQIDEVTIFEEKEISPNLEIAPHILEHDRFIQKGDRHFFKYKQTLTNIRVSNNAFYFDIMKEIPGSSEVFGKDYFTIHYFNPTIVLLYNSNPGNYILISSAQDATKETISELIPFFARWNFSIIDTKFRLDTPFDLCREINGQFIISNHNFADAFTQFTQMALKGIYDPDDPQYLQFAQNTPSLSHVIQTNALQSYFNRPTFRFQLQLGRNNEMARISTRAHVELKNMTKFINDYLLKYLL